MDIGGWLRSLGLDQYEAAFRDNAITERVLPNLTAEDLKDLGVGMVGHRRTLLDAIAALRTDGPPVAIAPAQQSAARPTVAPIAEAVGERRYLTVMFCDLVGSTSISAQLDAEDWSELVCAYLDAASAAVTDMGGKVAKKLGDGLMALFGYPVAQEDDAERAVRAALSIQRALAEVNRKNVGKAPLVARIGIETSPVGVDAAGEIYGDAPNTAARVQGLAEPGTIVVTARVQRQVAGLFVAEEHGTHRLKGAPEPVTLYRILRASGAGRRAGQRNLTPLVGREEEIALLMRRWERARQGEGQLVLILGEPGLGKSRLIEELHSRLREVSHTWVEWSCSQLLQNTPLHPLAEWGRMRFGGADVPEQRLTDLENSLTQIKLDAAENAALLAPLLDIPLPPERVLTAAPEELRRRQLAALMNWAIASAKVQPLVLAVEDLHWFSIINPAQVRDFVRTKLGRNKTDGIDASRIREYCKLFKPLPWAPPSEAHRRLGELQTIRSGIIASLTEWKNRKNSGIIDAEAQALADATILHFTSQIGAVDKAIALAIENDSDLRSKRDLLLSISGVGDTLAGIVLAELPGPDVLHSSGEVVAYAGLNPRQHQSGTSVDRATRISKIGNAVLRAALYMPALSAMRYNPAIVALVTRLKSRGRLKPKQIVVAAMRKLLVLCFGVLKTGKPFDPAIAMGC